MTPRDAPTPTPAAAPVDSPEDPAAAVSNGFEAGEREVETAISMELIVVSTVVPFNAELDVLVVIIVPVDVFLLAEIVEEEEDGVSTVMLK